MVVVDITEDGEYILMDERSFKYAIYKLKSKIMGLAKQRSRIWRKRADHKKK